MHTTFLGLFDLGIGVDVGSRFELGFERLGDTAVAFYVHTRAFIASLFGSDRAAAAAGTGALTLAATYRWWKYGFFSLFTRILRPKVLDQGTRAKIFDLI